MSNTEISIDSGLWHDIATFFSRAVSACKCCFRGNPVSCWHPECDAHVYRPLARRVAAVRDNNIPSLPNSVKIEDEILSILRKQGRPMFPAWIILESTNSKANKYTAINRLVRRGELIAKRCCGSRMLFLPHDFAPTTTTKTKKRNPKNATSKNKCNSRGGATRRTSAGDICAGLADAWRDLGAE